jgi:hypothetical protein
MIRLRNTVQNWTKLSCGTLVITALAHLKWYGSITMKGSTPLSEQFRYDDTAPPHCSELKIVCNFRYGSGSTIMIRLQNNLGTRYKLFCCFRTYFAFGAGAFGKKSFGQKYHSEIFRIRSNFVWRTGHSETGLSEKSRSEKGRSEIWQCTGFGTLSNLRTPDLRTTYLRTNYLRTKNVRIGPLSECPILRMRNKSERE